MKEEDKHYKSNAKNTDKSKNMYINNININSSNDNKSLYNADNDKN